MRIKQKLIFLALCSALAANASAASRVTWQTIKSDNGERLELDKSRISRLANGQTAAWTRLTLGFDLPDPASGNRYTAIEALNTYDCETRRFATIKRVYVSGGKSVREESIPSPKSLEVYPGSVEDKLLVEVCKPRSVNEMKQVADLAAQIMASNAASDGKPAVMPADMRTAEASKPAAVIKVADSHGAAPAAEAAPAKRMIDLPKIDKSQVEDPYKTAKPEEAKKADAKEVKKPAEDKHGAAATHAAPAAPVVDRVAIERALATHGPRKAKPKKKKKVEPAEKHDAAEHKEHIHWAYEGPGGPLNWSKLENANQTCALGKRQSPIDIREGIKVDLENITFDYKNAQFTVVDNGHTIQVNIGEGNTIKVMGKTYQLVQFHFHKPSEERVNGKTYDMVAHLVHKDDDGKLAVVALLIEKGAEHPVIQTVWNNLPLEQNAETSPSVTIDLAKLLPEKRAYWTYMGSLTTPPCSEGVLWMVFKQPIQISPEQVSVFARLYKNNARPIQPANGRLIKESR